MEIKLNTCPPPVSAKNRINIIPPPAKKKITVGFSMMDFIHNLYLFQKGCILENVFLSSGKEETYYSLLHTRSTSLNHQTLPENSFQK